MAVASQRSRGEKEQHGLCRHPLYRTWQNLLDRCLNDKNPSFHNYGGRGITVDPVLMSFPAFLEAAGPRPTAKHQLDRIRNEEGYKSGNLRWVTKREQANNLRKNRLLTVDGQTQTLAAWAVRAGLAPSTLHYRLANGMTPAEAVKTPRRAAGRMNAPPTPSKKLRKATLVVNGEADSIRGWAMRAGLSPTTLRQRLKMGWAPERAVSQPARPRA